MIEALFPKKESNIQRVIDYFLTISQVNHTSLHLKEAIEGHVESPSMLSIKDILFEYGIDAVAIRKSNYSYEDFETPFICSFQQQDWSKPAFTVVIANEDDKISYLDPIGNTVKTIALTDFEAMDKEIILLLDTQQKKEELNYRQNQSKERSQNIIAQIPIYAFILVLLSSLGFMLLRADSLHWITPFFLISSTIGLLISLLLVWHEVDAHNPFIKEVCGGHGRKMNCDAVLSSSGATFLGISWAVWGFAYFAAFFLTIVLFSLEFSYSSLWSVFSVAAIMYLPFSLYYQYRVVKQWCPLCLLVLSVLLVNAAVSIYTLSTSGSIFFDWPSVLHIGVIGLIFLLLTYYAIPILKQARESKSYAKRWKKLRYNRDIFQALLTKSEKITVSTEGLGIVIGNPNASTEIVKVCNPYCGPCAKAHPELEHIIKNNTDLKIRIIFTASGENDDIRTAPVQHLLAIQEKEGERIAQQALDDWYLSEQKDYEVFAKKYPMNGELKLQKNKIDAMYDWCNEMKIRATPTIYINGYELPDSYRISELKNFF
ncbi:vitamin K epoxide reductase family protein [Sphingobacterium sp. SYP-B4668]|uniref:vitamin K epoxide reductase family protein n=1 Tax=Sphingobacterium sp. SYP-B4668 TaxID=2996035 RepID=UPI0022DCFFD7|nr:vitamin K epoxide reductase family protein [Sphingobacterium sp. SYP-B4668]